MGVAFDAQKSQKDPTLEWKIGSTSDYFILLFAEKLNTICEFQPDSSRNKILLAFEWIYKKKFDGSKWDSKFGSILFKNLWTKFAEFLHTKRPNLETLCNKP